MLREFGKNLRWFSTCGKDEFLVQKDKSVQQKVRIPLLKEWEKQYQGSRTLRKRKKGTGEQDSLS